MADFNEALKIILKNEGLYGNDPLDPGGETYKGISRKNHPKWEGWVIIDAAKTSANFPICLEDDFKLQALVGNLYKTEYWSKINGDYISDQDIATSIFDFAVNAGVVTCIKVIQKLIKVTIDGIMGLKSLERLNVYDQTNFKDAFSIAKIKLYIEICERRPLSKKYFFGWVRRAIFFLLIAISFSSCVTYNKCVDKFGQYSKDTVFIEKKVVVFVKVPADSTSTSVNIKDVKRDTIYVVKDSINNMTIEYWMDTTLFYVKAKSPEKLIGDTVFIHDSIPCPEQIILVKKISKFQEWWNSYKSFSAWFLIVGIVILVLTIFLKK